MRDYLLQLKTQALELWQKMTRIQRTVIICSAVLLFGTLILLTRGATRPDYGTLFTQLDDQHAGQIVEKLKEKKIQFKLSDTGSGTTVMVPTKDITQTRLELASEGYPTGGVVGFEDFDNTKFGETDTDRRARYLRALQGELTRTIEGMVEVSKARVHIVLPEPSLFLDEQKNATAAVMLKLQPNKNLKEDQVRGLVQLIANSVEGLKPENVTIVDTTGNILSEDIGTDEKSQQNKLTMTQVELQKQFQKELQNSVQSMLERIVGVGKAVVRVQLELDFNRIQQKTQQFGNNVIRSRQVVEETSRSDSTGNIGAPGTDSNIPGYETGTETGSSESSKSEKIENYEVSSEETVKEVAPGSIKHLSVAVVIDKEIDTKQQKDIEEIVKSAVGFKSDRGDQISVAGMPFNTAYQDAMNAEIAKAEKQQQMMVYAGLAALALLVIGGVLASIVVKKRRVRTVETAIEGGIVVPVPVEEMEELVTLEKEMTPEEKERKRIKEKVEKAAREHPDDVAQLLKTWLAEE